MLKQAAEFNIAESNRLPPIGPWYLLLMRRSGELKKKERVNMVTVPQEALLERNALTLHP